MKSRKGASVIFKNISNQDKLRPFWNEQQKIKGMGNKLCSEWLACILIQRKERRLLYVLPLASHVLMTSINPQSCWHFICHRIKFPGYPIFICFIFIFELYLFLARAFLILWKIVKIWGQKVHLRTHFRGELMK